MPKKSSCKSAQENFVRPNPEKDKSAKREYERLQGHQPSFKDFLMQGPNSEDLLLERDTSPMRAVKP